MNNINSTLQTTTINNNNLEVEDTRDLDHSHNSSKRQLPQPPQISTSIAGKHPNNSYILISIRL